MQGERWTTYRVICSLALLCVLMVVLSFTPRYAWADESGDIPVGVLTLCDNPFAIDCGHNHEGRGEVCHSEEPGGVESPAAAGRSEEARRFEERNDEGSQEILRFVQDDDGDASSLIEAPVQDGDSYQSNAGDDALAIPPASSGDAIVVVDDEGLASHEYATVLAEVPAGISRAEFNEMIAGAGGIDTSFVSDEDLASGLVKLGISDSSGVIETVDRLSAIDGFLSVQPNYVYRTDASGSYTVINDRYASRQWEHDSIGTRSAWDIVKTQNSVAVAIIDTGANLDHPDLAANIIATYNSLSAVNTVEDTIGHGSHIAGIIAGVANNSAGVAGTSYNANLVIIKATPYKSNDFTTEAIVRAYNWLESLDSSGGTVAQHYNVRVVNLSLGGLDSARSANMPDDILNKTIRKAKEEYGLLTVVSAGNGGSGRLPYASYPGDSDAALSVMNLKRVTDTPSGTSNVVLSESSNYNVAGTAYKDICAPGTDIISTWINKGYALSSGTSMSAPIVSAVAAMMFAVNPYLTPQMVMSMLAFTATDLGDEGWDEKYGYGEVNAAAAVRLANVSRIDGAGVVGVGSSASFSASLGLDMLEDGTGRTWRVLSGTGGATVDENGVLTGTRAGTVTLYSTCTATTGATITAEKTVYVLDASIIGSSYVHAGESTSPFTTTAPEWTWVWQVENDTGRARIDQDAILVTEKAGVVYVTATCASNPNIVLRRKFTIVA